jgi:ABC-2 type transporter
MFAALSPTIDEAVRFSGIALNLLVIYTGYVIPKPQLVSQYIWFGWLYYINLLAMRLKPFSPTSFRIVSCHVLLRRLFLVALATLIRDMKAAQYLERHLGVWRYRARLTWMRVFNIRGHICGGISVLVSAFSCIL